MREDCAFIRESPRTYAVCAVIHSRADEHSSRRSVTRSPFAVSLPFRNGGTVKRNRGPQPEDFLGPRSVTESILCRLVIRALEMEKQNRESVVATSLRHQSASLSGFNSAKLGGWVPCMSGAGGSSDFVNRSCTRRHAGTGGLLRRSFVLGNVSKGNW